MGFSWLQYGLRSCWISFSFSFFIKCTAQRPIRPNRVFDCCSRKLKRHLFFFSFPAENCVTFSAEAKTELTLQTRSIERSRWRYPFMPTSNGEYSILRGKAMYRLSSRVWLSGGDKQGSKPPSQPARGSAECCKLPRRDTDPPRLKVFSHHLVSVLWSPSAS